jgi:hypothetical protein
MVPLLNQLALESAWYDSGKKDVSQGLDKAWRGEGLLYYEIIPFFLGIHFFSDLFGSRL